MISLAAEQEKKNVLEEMKGSVSPEALAVLRTVYDIAYIRGRSDLRGELTAVFLNREE